MVASLGVLSNVEIQAEAALLIVRVHYMVYRAQLPLEGVTVNKTD